MQKKAIIRQRKRGLVGASLTSKHSATAHRFNIGEVGEGDDYERWTLHMSTRTRPSLHGDEEDERLRHLICPTAEEAATVIVIEGSNGLRMHTAAARFPPSLDLRHALSPVAPRLLFPFLYVREHSF